MNMENPYSLQAMPEVPDTSYQAYQSQSYSDGRNHYNPRWLDWFYEHVGGESGYDSWKSQQLTNYENEKRLVEYNNQLYNNWLSSYSGQRSQLESAGYNPNMISPSQSSGVSDNIMSGASIPDSGFNGAPFKFGLKDILGLANTFMGFKLTGEQIANLKSQNENILSQAALNRSKAMYQDVLNRYIDKSLGLKQEGLGLQNQKTAYQIEQLGQSIDKGNFDMSVMLSDLYKEHPEYKGVLHYGKGSYQIDDAFLNTIGYQGDVQDIKNIQSLIHLRDVQNSLTKASAKAKNWMTENYYPVMLELLEGKVDLLDIEKALNVWKLDHADKVFIMDAVTTGSSAVSSLMGATGSLLGGIGGYNRGLKP